jgi:hypothetical protein
MEQQVEAVEVVEVIELALEELSQVGGGYSTVLA